MKLISISSVVFMVSALFTLLTGCGSRKQVLSHVSGTDYSRYVQKYPKIGQAVRQGRLTKDSAYALRNIAPQQQIMDQFIADTQAKSVEINARNIPDAEKRRLIQEYKHQSSKPYVQAANAAGRQAEQSGHSTITR